MRDRNHEGYHDPTACRAVRRAGRSKGHHVKPYKTQHLTYQLKEIRSFRKAVECLIVRS